MNTSKKGLIHNLKKHYDFYILLIPGILILFIFKYIPMYGITIAFQKFNVLDGYFGSQFVGFKHFRDLFSNPYFFRLFKNTLLLGVYSLAWSFWPPIILALLMNELRHLVFKKVVQTLSYLPHFISTVIVVGMLFKLASSNGVINQFLVSIGLERQQFFTDSRWFRSLYIGSGIWQGIGWGSIIYLASLCGIDEALYEAAKMEGANRFQRVLYITLPGITPTIVILFILNVRSVVTVGFEKVYLMYNPAVYETADVFSTFIYRRGIIGGDYSYTTAVGLFNSVVALILIIVCNKLAKTFGDTSLW